MSIIAQKRNSRRFTNPISGKAGGFSLNGGLRNQGWVGQTSSSRTLVHTPFRGSIPMGNGGCCGTYPVNIVSGANCCTNDASIIKRSNMNTKGHINSTVVYPTGVFNASCTRTCVGSQPVKPHVPTPENMAQSLHIETVGDRTLECEAKFNCENPGLVNLNPPRATQVRRFGALRTNVPSISHAAQAPLTSAQWTQIRTAVDRSYTTDRA